ncbi:MAG: fimbrial biogenesis chaperone, partial [Sphingopyxis terrae]
MLRFFMGFCRLAAAVCSCAAPSAHAAGDLLVAPTRVILDGSRGTEVVLNNIGAEPATYRVSLEV